MRNQQFTANEHIVKDLRAEKLRIKADCPVPLREIMEEIVKHPEVELAWKKHSEHSRSSQKGCVMGCVMG